MTIENYIKHLKNMIEEFKEDKQKFSNTGFDYIAGFFEGKIQSCQIVIKQLETFYNHDE